MERFGSLNAVRTGRLVAFEDQRLNRLGPSVVLATEALCKALAAAGPSRRRGTEPVHAPVAGCQSRKLLNCSGISTFEARNSCIADCRSSRLLPVTRTLSPWRLACTLSFESLIMRMSFLPDFLVEALFEDHVLLGARPGSSPGL